MGPEIKYEAALIIQDGLIGPVAEAYGKELGKRYLIQVDVREPGRFFIDATNLILRVYENSLPESGEYYLDGNVPKEAKS